MDIILISRLSTKNNHSRRKSFLLKKSFKSTVVRKFFIRLRDAGYVKEKRVEHAERPARTVMIQIKEHLLDLIEDDPIMNQWATVAQFEVSHKHSVEDIKTRTI